ncbi:MAG: 2-polyprenylphenol 6-hydroxylase [Alphaproteobacteria bacterium]|nr:2-polyprenylphenol 6-hydroxylase [Alphaproteobacteria bacterium]
MLRLLFHPLRIARILWVLARHDALYWPQLMGEGALMQGALRALARHRLPERPGERLALALQRLGPSFVKLGQALSTRGDILGEAVARDLAALQDRLPPFAGAPAVVSQALGAELSTRFTEFSPEPVAAASIAQVHFAVTTEGEPVAVKVLRPGVERRFERDLSLFAWMAWLVHALFPFTRRFRPREVVAVFARSVRIELDLRLEAAAAAELAENFADHPGFHVPAVDWQRTGRRVMTLERVEGLRIDNAAAIRAAGHDTHRIMAIAAEVFFRQVFVDGFFHADMHPGNVFVRPDGGLTVVDFGIMGRLDAAGQDFMADVLVGFLRRDYRLVAEAHVRAGFLPKGQDPAVFAQALRAVGEPILDRPIAEISMARLLLHLFQVTAQFDMPAQPSLLLLQKTMLMAEGLGRNLDDTIDMWTIARPLIEDWMIQNRGPDARLAAGLQQAVATLERLPRLVEHAEVLGERALNGKGGGVSPWWAAAAGAIGLLLGLVLG